MDISYRIKKRSGWKNGSVNYLAKLLEEHILKGDTVDVANFVGMFYAKGLKVQTPRYNTPQWGNN